MRFYDFVILVSGGSGLRLTKGLEKIYINRSILLKNCQIHTSQKIKSCNWNFSFSHSLFEFITWIDSFSKNRCEKKDKYRLYIHSGMLSLNFYEHLKGTLNFYIKIIFNEMKFFSMICEGLSLITANGISFQKINGGRTYCLSYQLIK